MSEVTFARRMDGAVKPTSIMSGIVTEEIDKRIIPWIGKDTLDVSLEGFPTGNGDEIWVGRIDETYPNSGSSSVAAEDAFSAYQDYVRGNIRNPMLRAYDYLTSGKSNHPGVFVILFKPQNGNALALYEIHPASLKRYGYSRLFLGGCLAAERPAFEGLLRNMGYKGKKDNRLRR